MRTPVVPARMRPFSPALAAELVGLVGEDAADEGAEVLAERLGEPVVHQPYEAGDRRRVEQVGRGGLILGAGGLVGIGVVQAADMAGGRAVVEREAGAAGALGDRRQVVARLQGRLLAGGQHLVVQAARLQRRIGGDHLAAGRAGGVHALVVQVDQQTAPPRLLDRHVHEVQEALGHPADVARQADARVDHEAVHAVRLEVVDLAYQLVLGEHVVPEPERHHGELPRRIGQCAQHAGSRPHHGRRVTRGSVEFRSAFARQVFPRDALQDHPAELV